MKLFVTVGTTPFDALIRKADSQLSNDFELISQISEGQYKPKHHQYFRFSDQVENYINDADIVISHGGAGTIFKVLEMSKKLIIVPNFDRVDHHQSDICEYMDRNNHAEACIDLTNLLDLVNKVKKTEFLPYKPDEFRGIGEIRNFLGLNSK